jgi:putative glycosyltransferase (TIGR04372 family)
LERNGQREAPFGKSTIAVFLGTQALGDFVMYHVAAASVARELPGSRLVAIYRDDRPYKKLLTLLNPFVSRGVSLPPDPATVAPIDWLDGNGPSPERGNVPPGWFAEGLDEAQILLTPSMLEMGRCILPAPRFQVPSALVASLGEALCRRGLDPGRWFACLHMREAGYQYRRLVDESRSVDPATYLPAVIDVIRRQGGQVVRLGDPSMRPFPAIEGFIDLSRDSDSFPEQAFAVSRARYFLATDSGPTQIGSAFGTPTATTNALTATIWNSHDVVLFKRVRMPDGSWLPPERLLDVSHWFGSIRPFALEFVDNTPNELVAVARYMHDQTDGCAGWREDAGQPDYIPSGRITLPLPWDTLLAKARPTVWPPNA